VATTRAVRLLRHGEPLAVEEVELPEPGPDEVLLEVAYAGVNPVDRYTALGRVAPDGPLPRTLGSEASGVVNGRAVVVNGHGLGAGRDGLWAERAVVPAAAVVDLPEGADLLQASTMGVGGRTAWRTTVDLAETGPGDRVLVLGASGGVGSLIVSLAGHLGATVWGHTGNAEKADWVRRRGADAVVVAGDGAELASDDELRRFAPTVVLDNLGGSYTGACAELAAPGARLVLYGTSAAGSGELPLQALYRKGLRLLGYGGLIENAESARAGIVNALRALAEGRLEVPVDAVLGLEEANEAFERLVERRVRGKLVLDARR
jgi:NADPH2:quinone reductase